MHIFKCYRDCEKSACPDSQGLCKYFKNRGRDFARGCNRCRRRRLGHGERMGPRRWWINGAGIRAKTAINKPTADIENNLLRDLERKTTLTLIWIYLGGGMFWRRVMYGVF